MISAKEKHSKRLSEQPTQPTQHNTNNNLFGPTRSIECANKSDQSIVKKNNFPDYNALRSVAIEHSDFFQKQISAALIEQVGIDEKINTTHPDFHYICLNLSKQIDSDINFISLLHAHLDTLINLLKSDEIDTTTLSECCILFVLELYLKIEYLKIAIKTVTTCSSQETPPQEHLHALFLTDALDTFRNDKYCHTQENIKILLKIQKSYLNFILINAINSSQSCYTLGYVSLCHHENWSAVEYFKQGISLFPTQNEDYYKYLGNIHTLLRTNKCNQTTDLKLLPFFNSIDKIYKAYLKANI